MKNSLTIADLNSTIELSKLNIPIKILGILLIQNLHLKCNDKEQIVFKFKKTTKEYIF